MIVIKTRKLPATSTGVARMRATASNGASLTIVYPEFEDDPNECVARALMRAMYTGGPYTVERVSEHVWLSEEY